MPSRPLTLHSSALSDAEHDLYMESLKDILSPLPTQDSPESDEFFEHATVGVREARAWIRGRYSTVSNEQVDSILALLGPKDGLMTAGQFFAALRLVLHALHGEKIESKWVFIQASPLTKSEPRRSSASYAPPSHPFRTNPKTRTPSPSKNPFTSPPPPKSLPLSNHKPAPSIPPKPKTITSPGKSNNPFLPPPPHPVLPPRKASQTSVQAPLISTVLTNANAPSLTSRLSPPGKPSTPAYTPSLNNVRMFQPDIVSPKPVHPPPPSNQTVARILTTHVTSPLIKMSLEASKEERERRNREEEMERERVVGVLKSSSATKIGGSSRSRSRSASISTVTSSSTSSEGKRQQRKKPPLPVRRPSAATTGASSATFRSLEQIAITSAPHHPAPPPSHPTRSHRSNSTDKEKDILPPPPVPPPRRRPESLSGPLLNSNYNSLSTSRSSPFPSPNKSTASGLARALSLSTRGARYKAEASLASKRGFLPASGWVDDSTLDGNGKVGLLRDEPGVDGDETEWERDRERERFRSEMKGEEWGQL